MEMFNQPHSRLFGEKLQEINEKITFSKKSDFFKVLYM